MWKSCLFFSSQYSDGLMGYRKASSTKPFFALQILMSCFENWICYRGKARQNVIVIQYIWVFHCCKKIHSNPPKICSHTRSYIKFYADILMHASLTLSYRFVYVYMHSNGLISSFQFYLIIFLPVHWTWSAPLKDFLETNLVFS